jgi:hypothetical protein
MPKNFTTVWDSISHINPSAWSDGHCLHSEIVAYRGVTGSARILH